MHCSASLLRRIWFSRVIRVLVVAFIAAIGLRAAERPQARWESVVAWTFDQPGDRRGWQPNADLTNVVVADGAMQCRAVGADPILELQAPLSFAAEPWQAFEVRLKADHDGMAELFWSNTAEGRFGGFSQEKSTRFPVTGDGRWATYRVLPGWHNEGRIVRLRFDLYDATQFAVASIRVARWTQPAVSEATEFNFPADDAAWPEVVLGRLPEPGQARAEATTVRFGPPMRVDAVALNYLALRLTTPPWEVAAGGARPRGRLLFLTDREPGIKSLMFPLTADGRERFENLDLLAAPGWKGRVLGLGLEFTGTGGRDPEWRFAKLADAPQGPARIEIASFARTELTPRVGRPTRIEARLRNVGGAAPVERSRVTLTVPPTMAFTNAPEPRPSVAALRPGDEALWAWELSATQPLNGQVVLTVEADGADPVTARCGVGFLPAITTPRADYVPEPKPVRGPFEVGAYYFPGWKTASQWHPIQSFPERRPVLGWYREGDPEVADWQIKWAVEHGITFFAYDWYWSQGSRQLEHALHDGFFQARYRRFLKFCLLWANHNAPGTSSEADCLAVTRYWIANYFQRPEHLRVGGRPVVIIFSPDRLREDLGAPGVKAAFERMRGLCREAGLGGLGLVACVGDAAQARQAAAEGYDAVTAYNWPGLGVPAGELEAPFATLLPGYVGNWSHILETAGIPLWLPLCGGWDSRPWHGANNLVRTGRNPTLFHQHVLDGLQFAKAHEGPSLPAVWLVEAWNEFGEGSYIEPHLEFGFGYLDALRAAIAPNAPLHVDVTPSDVGRGPFDVPPEPPGRTAWVFDHDEAGWNQTMDLTALRMEAGAMEARSTGNDPAWFGPPCKVRAADFGAVRLRLRLRRVDGQPFRDQAQLFWRTDRLPESEASSERFEVIGDGAWHEYRIAVGGNRRWRGTVTRLRLDPCNQREVELGLAWLRLER